MIEIMTIEQARSYPDPKQIAFDGDRAIVRTGDDIIAYEQDVIIVTKPQLEIALHRMGRLQDVENAVSASNNEELKIWWRSQLEFHSNNLKVLGMGYQLGINVRELFELAQSIKP